MSDCEALASDRVEILPVGEEHLPQLVALAAVIWRAHYPGIISLAQIEYMLARMYSLETIRREMREEGISYYRLVIEGVMRGFASIGPEGERVMKLHKLYVQPELQGRGLGSRLLCHCENQSVRLGANQLILAVNKRNMKAIAAYKRNGYKVIESVVNDIGGGFVMDDFVMAKSLPE